MTTKNLASVVAMLRAKIDFFVAAHAIETAANSAISTLGVWIPVAEDLCPYEDDVLVLCDSFGGARVGYFASEGRWFVYDTDPAAEDDFECSPSHWMPLPPRP